MSNQEHPDRLHPEHRVTVDDVRQLMGASTPHFALQLRERIRRLIAPLPADHAARIEGEREITRLGAIAFSGEVRGDPGEPGMPALPSVSERAVEATPGGHGH